MNRHFRLVFKIMFGVLALALILGVLISIVAPYFFSEDEVYNCLDTDGSFNYDTCVCDYENNHQFKADHQCK